MRLDSLLVITSLMLCHIVPFSVGHKDRVDKVDNGIALCPNLHRAFDRGLVRAGEKGTIQVLW